MTAFASPRAKADISAHARSSGKAATASICSVCNLELVMATGDPQPHSALYFGAVRDFWWNVDYLDLMASRLGLDRVRSVLDVGSGVGHWGRVLAAVLSDEVNVVGIDSEPAWVAEATRIAEQRGLTERFHYELGSAEQIQFPSSKFDLVTCQTLLIHVRDPQVVLAEMLRVLKPGGWLLLTEPNNLASQAIGSSLTAGFSIEQIVARFEFALACERGKEVLGEGNLSVGDLLPGYLAQLGVQDVQTYMSDKTSAMFSPYESEEQRELRAAELEAGNADQWIWPQDQARRYFLAGGGTNEQFDRAWQQRLQENKLTAEAIKASTFHSAGGVVQYVIAGQRPRED